MLTLRDCKVPDPPPGEGPRSVNSKDPVGKGFPWAVPRNRGGW